MEILGANSKTADHLSVAKNLFFSQTRNRIKTSNPSSRSNHDLAKEMREASKIRIHKELSRPKIIIPSPSIETPKPASFYIDQARADYVYKIGQFKSPTSVAYERIKTSSTELRKPLKQLETPKINPFHIKTYSQTNTVRSVSPLRKDNNLQGVIPE